MLTDIMMPGISGPDLANRLRASNGSLVVLYMSGYDRDGLTKMGDPEAQFMPKPFSPSALLTRIAELLGSRSQRDGGSLGASLAC
jgi:DNA-binding response OmpR family regulator